jgi:hypothetical protein
MQFDSYTGAWAHLPLREGMLEMATGYIGCYYTPAPFPQLTCQGMAVTTIWLAGKGLGAIAGLTDRSIARPIATCHYSSLVLVCFSASLSGSSLATGDTVYAASAVNYLQSPLDGVYKPYGKSGLNSYLKPGSTN